MNAPISSGAVAAGEAARAMNFIELRKLALEEINAGFWRHVPRVIYECWQAAGGTRTSEETTEQRHIGRWRNSYVFLESIGNVKSLSHVLNGRVLFTRQLARALLRDMLTYWAFDSHAVKKHHRTQILECSDLSGAADDLVQQIFSKTPPHEREAFKVSKLRVQDISYVDFASELKRYSNIYILSRYRSVRGVGREQALASMFDSQQAAPVPASSTAVAQFASIGGALASSLKETTSCWTWVCDFGIPAQGRGGSDEIDWLAYLNFSALRSAFHAFLELHSRASAELVKEANERCRFVIKNSPTLSSKRAELFRDVQFIESLSNDPATLTANLLPSHMPSEWAPLLVGDGGQVQKLFPQTIIAGHRDMFEFYYFPGDFDSKASIDTFQIDAAYQPIGLIQSLRLASSALDVASSNDALDARKKLAFLSWDVLSLKELMELGHIKDS